ncbi:hypothetical protein HDV05_006821 [Chytridiales sp. JEL 0842]|nr:hypothetical protein HDV05_006821 [Chytridiales sp. JEL 0842]
MGPKAAAKNLDIRFNVPFTSPPFVADAFRIRQVIINLFSNSVVYTEQGSVTLGLEYLQLPPSKVGPPSSESTQQSSKRLNDSLAGIDSHPGTPLGSRRTHTVSKEASISFLRISVTDTGVGMTETEMRHLFQKFSQPTAAVSREQQYEGSGLGLVISKKLVELMGGWMEIESVKGVGSKFSFTIKEGTVGKEEEEEGGLMSESTRLGEKGIASAGGSSDGLSVLNPSNLPLDSPEEQKGAGIVPRKPAESILIVEDNVINQKVMERILIQCKRKITTVNNGLEAVELIKASPDHGIDLIFMDINMPIMDGLKATEEIRKIECERAFADQQHRKSSSPSSTDSNATLDDNYPSSLSNSDDDSGIDHRRRLTIIGISGNAREQSVQNALGKGMDGYITKPWKKEDIYKVIEHGA